MRSAAPARSGIDLAAVNDPGSCVVAGSEEHIRNFQARLAEAGTLVAYHSGESGYGRYAADWGEDPEFEAFRRSPFKAMLQSDRAIADTMTALIAHGVFHRFPNVRVATIESGSEWVAPLIKKMAKSYSQSPGTWPGGEDPVAVMREHVWVAPYYEDDIRALASSLGAERVLFGSDWPHAEGLAEPASFIDDLAFMVLATPIFYPAVLKLGFDPLWFGMIVGVTVMIGVVTATGHGREAAWQAVQAGVSGVRRLHGLAEAALDGRLETSALRELPEADALARLQELPGIGASLGLDRLLAAMEELGMLAKVFDQDLYNMPRVDRKSVV